MNSRTIDWEGEKKIRLGEIGEKIVANYESAKGNRVFMSLNPFDCDKDLRVNDLVCEVKTQVPYFSKEAFTFRPSQKNKILSVDRLYIVSVDVETIYYDQRIVNVVYILDNPKETARIGTTETSHGKMIYIPIACFKPYFRITDMRARGLLKLYSSSLTEEQLINKYVNL